MTPLWLARARLRRDVRVATLAPLLLPEGDDQRALAAHRLIWSLMPSDAAARRDFLWREEAPGRFLVLSPRCLDASALFEVEAKPFEPALRAGDRLGFALRANPTVTRSGPRDRGTRADVVMDALHPLPQAERAAARPTLMREAGLEWLIRTGARHGFSPDPGGTVVDGYRMLRIPRRGAKPARVGTLDYAGTLTVGDPAAFLAGLASGFGRARAFGCGLMLIRRAS